MSLGRSEARPEGGRGQRREAADGPCETERVLASDVNRAWRREAVIVGIASALAIGVLFLSNPGEYGLETRLLAMLVAVAGLGPGVVWLGWGARESLPVFEMYMAFHGVCFGLAGFAEQVSTLTVRATLSEEAWQLALWAALLSETATLIGYGAVRKRRAAANVWAAWKRRRSGALLPASVAVLLIGTLLLGVLGSFVPVWLRQVTGNIGTFWFYILIIGALRREMRQRDRLVVYFLLVPFMLFQLSSFRTGAIYGLFSTLIPLGAAFTAVRRRLPLALGATVVVGFFLLQPVKSEFRRLAQDDGSPTEGGAAKFVSLAVSRFEEFLETGGTVRDWMSGGVSRLNHLHVTAAVIQDTPAVVPFQNGATYVALFTKLIPRALWPGKPREDLGNRWAHEYGFLYATDFVTSFNLPFVTEMFMNFGYLGVFSVSFVLGMLMKTLRPIIWRGDAPTAMLAMGLLAGLPFFTPESNLSLQLGRTMISLASAGISLVLLSVLSRRREGPRQAPNGRGRG